VREQPERVAGHGIDDIVRHYAEIARTLGAPPIVIGTRSAGSSRSGCSVRTSRRPPSRSTPRR
jgi:hypothetical protein